MSNKIFKKLISLKNASIAEYSPIKYHKYHYTTVDEKKRNVVIFGPEPSINIQGLTWNEINKKVDGNTGNLAFCHAIHLLIENKTKTLPWGGHTFNPDDSIGVMECANHLNSHINMGFMCDWLRKYPVPMVTLGLGAQSEEKYGSNTEFAIPTFSLGTRGWIKELSRHSLFAKPNIGVRGKFSFSVIEHLGLADHAEILGCPSLFISSNPHLGQEIIKNFKEPKRIAFASGNMYWENLAPLENALSEIMTASDGEFVTCCNVSMMRIGNGEYDLLDDKEKILSHNHFYKKLSQEEFSAWTKARGHVFFDIPSWMNFYKNFDFVVGPRIHGIMLALQAGIPAVCIAIDSRTKELCETMHIPHVMAAHIKSNITKKDLMNYFNFDPESFDTNRKFLANKFLTFFNNNGIQASQHLINLTKGNVA